MATPKKRYKYTFLYTDGTYLTYDLTREDFTLLEKALCEGEEWKHVSISIGIVATEGIRSIIEQKEPEVEEQPTEEVDTLPVLDQESYEWIKNFVGGDK